jgi:hypothetical protein
MFLKNIFEALARTGEGKAAVVGWGRGMGHKGHMYLASSVITHANQLGADPYFVVSRTVGKDDPITPEEKLAIYKKVFPEQGHIFQTATDEIPDLTRVLSDLNRQGYTSATIVLGADQVKAFQYLKNYNGKPDKAGNVPYKFDTLDVISRQETGDPSAGEEGPRATPMRAVLMDPTKSEEEQFQVWRDAMNPQISDDEVRDLMMKAKERMTAMSAPKPKKAKAVAEGLHPMVAADLEKLKTLNPVDRFSAYSNIRDYFKGDPELSKMASDLMGGYYEADMLRGKYKTDAAKAKYAELEPIHQEFITQALSQEQGVAEGFNGEYDDEAGMAQSNLLTTARAVQGLLDTIKDRDNLPEWAQEKIAKAEMMLVSVWDYLQSQKEMGNDPQVDMEEGRSYYDNRTGFSRGPRDDERHELDVPRQDPSEFRMYNLTIDGKPLNPQPIMGRSNLIKFGKQQAAAGVDLSNAMISLVDEGVEETDAYMESLSAKLEEKIAEDAKVDRQAKHITKSMMKAHPGMSKDDAESAAWAHIKHPKKNKK